MKYIINTLNKKIYVIEIILVILSLIFLGVVIYMFVSPSGKQAEKRDEQRKNEINAIYDAMQKYITADSGSIEFLKSNIELCVNGWTEIGTESERVNLKSVLASHTSENLVDPNVSSDAPYSGYDICRSYEADRYIIRATKAEFEVISITKKLDLGKK